MLKENHITAKKGKMSFIPPHASYYRKCVVYYGTYEGDFEVGLKILSDNMNEPSISVAIKTEDLKRLNNRVTDIVSLSKHFLNQQHEEIEDEDKLARYQMNVSKSYLWLTVIQIMILLCLGIYQIYNFKKFLLLSRII